MMFCPDTLGYPGAWSGGIRSNPVRSIGPVRLELSGAGKEDRIAKL